MKLQTKFLVILFPLVVVPLLLNSYITRHHFAEMMGESVDQQNKILKEQMQWNVDMAHHATQEILAEMLGYPELVDAADNKVDRSEIKFVRQGICHRIAKPG